MHLKQLELYGFKSFAEKTDMLFGKGITGVVGPNGSGKSNIADAVRWVLGEQSAKALRGGKMEDVIFAGTQSRKALGYCMVSLTFDNLSKTLPVDYSEVKVSRRVFRNGEGEYFINGTPCRLKDIVDLFKDTGIGKEGYSLIGQGRIDEILSVKSEDRRAVFEEAAGIVKTKSRKQEAEKRLEAAAQNLVRLDDILAELHAQIEPLLEQADAARTWLKLRDEQRDIDLNLFIRDYDEWETRVKQFQEQAEQLENERTRTRALLEELSSERDAVNAELDQTSKDLTAQRERLLERTRRNEADEGALGVLRERASALERDMRRLADGKAELGATLETTRTAIILQSEEEDHKRKQLAALIERRGELEAQIERLAKAEAEAEEALEEAKSGRLQSMNRAADMKTAEARLSTLKTEMGRRLEQFAAQRETLEAELPAVSREEDAAREHLRQTVMALEAARAELTSAQKLSEEQAERIARMDELARKQEGNGRELASRLNMLQEMARDYEGFGQSVKAVMQESARRGGVGIRGVVATLLDVPKELERALEMSLGGQMQNIVVNAEEDAKAMIEHLRATRQGRATFLPLSSMRPRLLTPVERQCLTMPGCVGVASELVRYDPAYKPVMDSLLGRTVIARDLNSGIAIMRKGGHAFRLVTLEGDVMHSGGSMTGGSVQSRVTSLLSREREIAEHVQAVKDCADKVKEAESQVSAARDIRAQLKEKLAALYEAERQADIALTRDTQGAQAACERVESVKKRIAELDNEIISLRGAIADIDAELTRHLAEGVGVSEEDWTRDIAQRQETARSARAALEAGRADLSKLQVSVTAAEHKAAEAARELKRVREEAAQSRTSTERIADEQTRVIHEQAALVERIRQSETDLTESRAELGRASERASELQNAHDALSERERGLNDGIRNAQASSDELGERIHRARLSLERVENDKKSAAERVWNEYELTYGNARPYYREDFEVKGAKRRAEEIRAEIRAMGPVNPQAIEEYTRVSERYEHLTSQREDVIAAQADLESIIAELVRQMEVQFREQFAQLNRYFAQTFSELFGGGSAELKLVDEDDVLNCGIEITAQPPGKKLQLLSLLSGGERALTAIAILFAMLSLKPTPFCVLDEIEAALDDANIQHFADFLARFSKTTQFIVVTHRKPTMERCDVLYGIAMEEKGISRMVSVRLTEQLAAAQTS